MAKNKDSEQDDHPTFKPATVLKILETGFKNEGKTISMSKPALTMATEYIRLFTLEAIHRSAESLKTDPKEIKRQKEGKGDGGDAIMDVKYLHMNAAALTLDFGV